MHKVSKELPPAHAAFAEPLSCALHAVERAELGFDDVVVVAGCGPNGLGMIAGAKARNPSLVIGLDYTPNRLSIALDARADLVINIAETDPVAKIKDLTGGYGADIYLEATGHPSAVDQGLTCCASSALTLSTARSAVVPRSTGRSSATKRSWTYVVHTSGRTAGPPRSC